MTVRPPVLTKADFVRRYQLGEFGNASRSWQDLKTWVQSDPEPLELYHIRNRIKGGKTYYGIPGWTLRIWYEQGKFHEPNWYISEMAPTEHTIIQGEVRQSERGLDLFYSTVIAPMRQSLEEGGTSVSGLMAHLLLSSKVDPVGYDWIRYLLNEYPDHTVEFSTYGRRCGTRNLYTIIWEVRLY